MDIFRRLAVEYHAANIADLATSLNKLSVALANVGRNDDALDTSREAVDMRRVLAAQQPDAFLPYLAMSLNTLGNRLSSSVGRCAEALAAFKEAISIRRALANDKPDTFVPDLATSLGAMSQATSTWRPHRQHTRGLWRSHRTSSSNPWPSAISPGP